VSDAGEEELDTQFVSVKELRSDDSMTDRLLFLVALCLVALGAAAFAIAFRSSLTLWKDSGMVSDEELRNFSPVVNSGA
jgi:hypothetical protein